MAHRILGLDIGRRAIKMAIVDKTLRQTIISGWDEEPVQIGATDDERTDALRRLLARHARPDDFIAVGLPTDLCMHRTLLFPFRDDKAIAEAVGFELENHIPTPLDELVLDHVRLGDKDGQSEVLALAAPRVQVEKFIAQLKSAGCEARRIGLNSLSYAALLRRLPQGGEGSTMVVDVGTRSTEVAVVVNGRTQFLRSLSVGADTINSLFSAQFAQDDNMADAIASHGFLLPHGALAESSQERTLNAATFQALAPLLRELRQTLAVWMRRSHARPDRLVLTGGVGKLAGLIDLLERSLGLPVEPVRLQDLPDMRVDRADRLGDTGALAVALALAAAEGVADEDVDFRQGDMAYEGNFKILRARLPQVAAFVVLALCLLGIRASLNYRALVIEREAQLVQVQAFSKTLTGKQLADFEELLAELKRESKIDMTALYPDMSSFKVLEDVTLAIDKVTEPPDFVPAGGPAEPEPPNERSGGRDAPSGRGRESAATTGQELPSTREGATREGIPGREAPTDPALGRAAVAEGAPGERGFGGRGFMPGATPIVPSPAAFGGPPGRGGADLAPPAALRGVGADAKLGKDGKPADKKDASDAGADDAKPKVFTGHKLELTAVQIERNNTTLRGEADTQDALLALQQQLEQHKCFHKVKSSSDRITFERHRDWFKFTVQFEVNCPTEEEKAAKKKAAKGDEAADEKAPKAAKKGAKGDEEPDPEE